MKKVKSHIRQGVQVKSYVAKTKALICKKQKYHAGIINPNEHISSVNPNIISMEAK